MRTWLLLLLWAEWAEGEECHAYLEQNAPFGSLHLTLDYEPLPALIVRLTELDCTEAPVYSPLLAVDGQPSPAALPWTTDCGRYRSWRLQLANVAAVSSKIGQQQLSVTIARAGAVTKCSPTPLVLRVASAGAGGTYLRSLHQMVLDRPQVGLEVIHYTVNNQMRTLQVHPAAAFCGGGFAAGSQQYLGRPVAYDTNLITFFFGQLEQLQQKTKEVYMIDVGANTGSFTLLAGYLPGLHVHALEPVVVFSRILAASVRLNGLNGRVAVSTLAASNKTILEGKFISMPDARDGGLASLYTVKLDNHLKMPVITAKLDDLPMPSFANGSAARMPRVDVVKIDVEGAESMVIEGAAKLLGQWKPPVLLEASAGHAAKGGHRGDEAIALLQAMGYGIAGLFQSGHDGFDVFMQHGWRKRPRWVRILQTTQTNIIDANLSMSEQALAIARDIFPGSECFGS